MAMNFKDALDTNVSDIERPPLPPIGTYVFQITKQPAQDTIADGAWDVLDFQCVAVEATDDVDFDALREFGDLKNIRIRHRFMFNTADETAFKGSLHRLRRFLEEHVKVEFEGVPLKQALASSVNQRFLGTVGWRPDKNDPEIQYAEIRQTAPVE